MAEALVATNAMPRYFCHMCNVEISIPNEIFTCPICSGGFVEELPALVPRVPINPINVTGPSTSRTANGTSIVINDRDPFNRLAALMALRGEVARMAENENSPNAAQAPAPASGVPPGVQVIAPRASGNGPRAPQRQNIGPNFLIDFLNSLDGHFGPTSMVYLGNIGDYAWGREGIDTIVTQLLNQMETAGPPPLPKDKIKEIPKVQVSQEEIDKNTQCSVCWEDFVLNETVRKLPCSHIYHENCIIPWLDLHGTCPICRKSLNNDEEEGGGGGPGSISGRTRNSSNRRSGGENDGSDGNGGEERSSGTVPPTIPNSALDDLD